MMHGMQRGKRWSLPWLGSYIQNQLPWRRNKRAGRDVHWILSRGNMFSWGGEHQDDLDNRRESSALWKHCVEKHQSVPQNFEMVLTDRSRNDATKRQILEAVRIQRANAEHVMNGRSEWNSNRVPRLTVERNWYHRIGDVRYDLGIHSIVCNAVTRFFYIVC